MKFKFLFTLLLIGVMALGQSTKDCYTYSRVSNSENTEVQIRKVTSCFDYDNYTITLNKAIYSINSYKYTEEDNLLFYATKDGVEYMIMLAKSGSILISEPNSEIILIFHN